MNISRRIGSLTGRLAALAKQSRRGAAAVEFALMVPVVVAGLTGVANCGLVIFEKIEVESAARAGAQMAIRDRENTSAIQQTTVDSTNLTITTSDLGASGSGGTLTDTDTVSIAVSAVNKVPVIGALGGDTLAYTEGDAAVVLDQGLAATVTDVDSVNFDGGALTVGFGGTGQAGDVLSIRNQGTAVG